MDSSEFLGIPLDSSEFQLERGGDRKDLVTIIFSVEFYLPETSVLIRLGSDI